MNAAKTNSWLGNLVAPAIINVRFFAFRTVAFAQSPWLTNTPIASVQKEMYIQHTVYLNSKQIALNATALPGDCNVDGKVNGADNVPVLGGPTMARRAALATVSATNRFPSRRRALYW